MNAGRRGFGSLVALLLVVALIQGLALVWLNIERVDMAYGLKNRREELDTTTAHVTKLEVERENLLSPYRLRKMAAELGMEPAGPGQIRRLDGH